MTLLDRDTVRERINTAPPSKPALDTYGRPVALPELQYSPTHRTTFVGKPGALFRGSPSVTKAEGDAMLKAEAEAQEDATRDDAGEATPSPLATAPAVERKVDAPEVHVDAGAGAADPQIMAHDTSGPDVHVA